MTVEAVKEFGLSRKDAARAKNMFALGLVSWMYGRPTESTIAFLEKRFAKVPDIRDANITAFRAGWNFGETTEAFVVKYEIKPAPMKPGTYRNITGNLALAYGLVASGVRSGLPLFLGSYPITPASDILHELSKHKAFGVTTFQAEDEIAGIGAALGASFAGALGVTTTSGPGIALKSETIGLAVMTELPLIVIDVQRGGPSTGLPTKTEQADLLQAMFGRNGESPVPIVAPQSPGDCFDAAIEAVRIAVTYRTPVMLLSDGMLANGSEPWRIPELDELPDDRPGLRDRRATTGPATRTAEFWPYLRDEETLARPWAIPGTPGLEHRIGGLEKADGNGNISYDPANHDFMVRTRQAKVDRIAESLPPLVVDDPSGAAQGAGARLGLDVRADRRRLPPGAQRRLQRRAGAPAPPQPAAARPRRHPQALRPGAHPRDEPRPARPADPRRSTSSTPSATTRSTACRSRRPRSPTPSPTWSPRPRASRRRSALGRDRREGARAMSTDRPARPRHAQRHRAGADRRRRRRPPRSSPPTRRCAGARAAATTPCSRPCRASCPTSGCGARTSCSSPASAAPRGSPTTSTPTACTRSTAARPAIATGIATLAVRPVGVGRHR